MFYGYCDFTDEGVPFYVGIGNLRRVNQRRRNKKHTAIANKHGFNRKVEITFVGERDEAWKMLCEWEAAMICSRDTMHRPTHIGCNFTIGGDGIRGFKRVKSEDERRKLSESKIALYSDPLERQKLGEAIHQAKMDPIKYQRHCDAQRRRYSNPGERQKAHIANTQKKRVQQITINGEVIAEYPSMSYAVQATGILNIKQVCQGKRKFAGGYCWRYVT